MSSDCIVTSPQTVKTWLGGVSGPNGEHLIRLICHSDVVFALVLARSGRARADVWDANARARRHILRALAALRDATSGAGMPEGDGRICESQPKHSDRILGRISFNKPNRHR